MTKKNKHLLKLLSLSLLPIAAISIPAVILTSCSSGKEESSDNSNNNQPNNPGDNGGEDNTNPGGEGNNGEDNNNPNVTNPTYPTFASADEVRKACDEAKIDSKYESEELFISETEYLSKFGSVLANNSKIANATIRYPQQDNLDTEKNEMDFMYITLFTTENKQISTNLSDYPMYLKDSSGNKWYINPNKAVRISFDELYMLSDEQLQYDSEEVQQLYKSYRDRRIWFKIDVSKYKEQVANLPISDSTNGYKLFIDYQQNLPNKNTNIMNSYIFRELDEENILSLRDLWTYRLSNDMRFGFTRIFGVGLFEDMDYYDNPDRFPHPTSTTMSNNYGSSDWFYIDPFDNDVLHEKDLEALKYIQNHPDTVRFIDSITYSAGTKGGDFVLYKPLYPGYVYEKINNKYISFDEAKDTKINYIYKQTADRDFVPSIINIDNKVIYDNVNLLDFQYRQLENGEYLYCPPNTTLKDLLLTVNGGKTFGYISFYKDYDDCKTDSDFLNWTYASSSNPWYHSQCNYYLPDIAIANQHIYDWDFLSVVDDYLYSTFTINFNQPNSK